MIKTQNNEIEVLDPKMQGEGAEAKNGTLVKKFGKKRNTGFGMKRSTRFEKIYLGIIFFLMYLPVAVVIIFSFNESKLPVRLTGFSLQWYEKLFADSAMMEALVNSLILGVASCAVSAVIGTFRRCRPVTDSLENKRRIGVHFHFAPYDTGNHSGYGADGIFLHAESALRNAYSADRTYGILHSLYIDGSKSQTCGHGSFP